MTKWNDIPFDESASPQEKADEFDAQFAENASAAGDKYEDVPWFSLKSGPKDEK